MLHTLLLFVHDVIHILSVNKIYNEIMYNVYTSFNIIIFSVSLLSTIIACIYWETQSWILNQGMEGSGYSPDIIFIPTLEQLLLAPHEMCVCVCVCACIQSHPTLCDPMDCRRSSSSVHEILQVRILQWLVMPSFRGSSQPRIKPLSPALAGGFFTTSTT